MKIIIFLLSLHVLSISSQTVIITENFDYYSSGFAPGGGSGAIDTNIWVIGYYF